MDIKACPKCGNIDLIETITQSGPHYSRIDCPDCGFIKWGKKPGKDGSRMQNAFLVGIPSDKRLEIGLGKYEQEHLLSEYNKTFHEFCKMTAWFNDTKVNPEEKVKFVPLLRNMIETIYIMTKIMDCSTFTDKEIAETLSLPF